MERAQKETVIADFQSDISKAQAVVLTEFRGLTVEQDTQLRANLRKAGVDYRVIKNTFAKRAIAGTRMEVLSQSLTGPTAWAYSATDPVGAAKVLLQFFKDQPTVAEHLVIKGGYLDGKRLSKDDVEALSKMPGRDELRSKFLGLLMATATQFVRVLGARQGEFLNLLKARQQQLEKAA
jgi:large subunit ribosomal protein L10